VPASFFLPPCYGGLPNRRPETDALIGGQADLKEGAIPHLLAMLLPCGLFPLLDSG